MYNTRKLEVLEIGRVSDKTIVEIRKQVAIATIKLMRFF